MQLVGLAVVAALIGAGGLGAIIFQGLLSSALDLVLLGVLPVVALALVVDAALPVAGAGGAAAVIELRQVHKRFGATRALDGVSLRIEPGAITALIGASGSGKSTLLRVINRLVERDAGQVLLDGQDIRTARPRRCAGAWATSSSPRGCFRTGRWRATSPPCRCCWAGRGADRCAGG